MSERTKAKTQAESRYSQAINRKGELYRRSTTGDTDIKITIKESGDVKSPIGRIRLGGKKTATRPIGSQVKQFDNDSQIDEIAEPDFGDDANENFMLTRKLSRGVRFAR